MNDESEVACSPTQIFFNSLWFFVLRRTSHLLFLSFSGVAGRLLPSCHLGLEALGLLVRRTQALFLGAGAAGGHHAKAGLSEVFLKHFPAVSGGKASNLRFFRYFGIFWVTCFFFLDSSCEFNPSSVGCQSTRVDEKCPRAH